MKNIVQELERRFRTRAYMVCVLLSAAVSYGFAICQPMIGVDDSAIGRYFEDGIGPLMGRFGFYLLNKICPVAEYTPFIVDFLGVVLLVIGSGLWIQVWERAMNRRLSDAAAIIFSCVMISCPMISEVFIYYLHNGVCLCYCISAVLMLTFMQAFEKKGKGRWRSLGLALFYLWLSNSFMESFAVVFLTAIVMTWTLNTVYKVKKITPRVVITEGLGAGLILAVSILLRSVTIEILTVVCSLQSQIGIMNRRSITEALGWFQSSQGMAEFVMTIKQYIAMYYVNSIAYLPVRIYLLAVTAFLIWAVYRLIKYRQLVPLLAAGAMQLIPLLLVFIEGHATFYRNSQFVPLYVAFVMMLLTSCLEQWAAGKAKCKKYKILWYVLMTVFVYNQAYEMTQWFYVDYMKYEDARNTVNLISYELESAYDTEKPVVFVGNYTIPSRIVEKMYVPYDSETYARIAAILDIMDPNLKTCFAMPDGYSLSSEAVYSVFTWGNIAFEVWDKETHEFFAIHGHAFNRIMDPESCREIQAAYQYLPGWPKEGSIVETEDYIVVKFG